MFSAANLKTALEINEVEKLCDREDIIERHLNLLKSPQMRCITRYCLLPPDTTKSPCLTVLEGHSCPDECPLELENLCQMIGVPVDKDLAVKIMMGKNISKFSKKSAINQKIAAEIL